MTLYDRLGAVMATHPELTPAQCLPIALNAQVVALLALPQPEPANGPE